MVGLFSVPALRVLSISVSPFEHDHRGAAGPQFAGQHQSHRPPPATTTSYAMPSPTGTPVRRLRHIDGLPPRLVMRVWRSKRGVVHRPAPWLATAVDPVMIVVKSPRTTRYATVTDATDRDLRSLNQQGLVLMLTR
jgi:hypothetical protein